MKATQKSEVKAGHSNQLTYDREGLAEATNLSLKTIDRLLKDGTIRSFKVRRRRLIARKEAERFVEECSQQAQAA